MIRPGPARLARGLAPGGFVAHAYGTADGRLLVVSVLAPGSYSDEQAVADREEAEVLLGEDEAIVLVLYDGDTGERVLPPGFRSGDRIEGGSW